jgi:hypothetical protein
METILEEALKNYHTIRPETLVYKRDILADEFNDFIENNIPKDQELSWLLDHIKSICIFSLKDDNKSFGNKIKSIEHYDHIIKSYIRKNGLKDFLTLPEIVAMTRIYLEYKVEGDIAYYSDGFKEVYIAYQIMLEAKEEELVEAKNDYLAEIANSYATERSQKFKRQRQSEIYSLFVSFLKDWYINRSIKPSYGRYI